MVRPGCPKDGHTAAGKATVLHTIAQLSVWLEGEGGRIVVPNIQDRAGWHTLPACSHPEACPTL